ncbi:MmcQ/YjbR family DNA-binding protein [Paenisporosarcina quisquiliarum]|uniref:MmcQ/YjbR family DNA-binding protein n=1 Tax=Paenisporosarcina quisquiliarum TaxID=365346 RepID=A0A9X3LHY4_9BACL|nr:MmcQ/YjbR family DNA-binding protein [Paenisporosarcina quisquiliarum]MCZ8536784.1 MmcQ/YjbR family DNA-binding protein [Paenisporosarcina quisquiliarum]
MEVSELKAWCAGHPGAKFDYQKDWNAERYLVGGKMFAMFGHDKSGTPILSVKCEPHRADMLREEYEDIKPGYYMNKTHWNSLALNGSLPDAIFKECITHSYELVFKGLTKKLQNEVTGQ